MHMYSETCCYEHLYTVSLANPSHTQIHVTIIYMYTRSTLSYPVQRAAGTPPASSSLIPRKMVAKIQVLQFVELRELLPDNMKLIKKSLHI